MELNTQTLSTLMPLSGAMGVQLVHAAPDQVTATLAWRQDLTTNGGALHGGTLMSLADSVGGLLAYLNLPDGKGTVTLSSNTVFIRDVRDGGVTATGRCVHAGRSTIVVETTVVNTAGQTVSQTTQTQAVLDV